MRTLSRKRTNPQIVFYLSGDCQIFRLAKEIYGLLVVYVEEGCDFALFDSLTYDICLRSCFLNADNFMNISAGPSTSAGGGFSYNTLNAEYACYLIKTSNINFPIWTAGLGTKGHIGAAQQQLNIKMAKILAKELKREGYWMH